MYGSLNPDVPTPTPSVNVESIEDELGILHAPGQSKLWRRGVLRFLLTCCVLTAVMLVVLLVTLIEHMATETPSEYADDDPTGPPLSPDALPPDPKNRLHHDDFVGNQVNTRRSFGYGLYVFEAIPNVHKEAVVTGLFTFIPRPPPNEYPKLTYIWRWSEIDWEFVPHTRSPQREHVRCKGAFPNAKCNTYRTWGENSNWTLRPKEVEGHYTNDKVVAALKQNLYAAKYWGYFKGISYDQIETIHNWNDLVNFTSDLDGSALFRYGEEWPLPGALCYAYVPNPQGGDPLCSQMLPTGQSLVNSVAINVFRMPYGRRIVEGRNGVKAPFVPHKKGDGMDVSGFAMTNEQFVYNPWFDPYTGYHTYTIRLAPDSVSFYIDAPGGGYDVSKVKPVQELKAKDYPGVETIGPQMPGGEIQWYPRYGIDIGHNNSLGGSQMMMNMWVDKGWGGPPRDFKSTSTYVRRVGFKPLKQTKKPWDQPFEVDFSKIDPKKWWPEFRKYFFIEQDDAGSKSVLNVRKSKGPDGKQALELRLCRRQMQLINKTFFQLSPAGHAIVTEVATGDVWAEATFPRYEFFPMPDDVDEVEVWVTVRGHKCGYTLFQGGWKLTPGRGDIDNGKTCTFMAADSNGGVTFKLQSGATKAIFPPGLPPPEPSPVQ